jgi:hypothetical protein
VPHRQIAPGSRFPETLDHPVRTAASVLVVGTPERPWSLILYIREAPDRGAARSSPLREKRSVLIPEL